MVGIDDVNDAEVLDLDLPNMRMRALAWGPQSGRLLLCVHGFPDSAVGWRLLAPMLAAKGYRVVAPFTRGYWPSELPADGNYQIGALMSDLYDLHESLGGPRDAVLVGHDWGGWTTNAIAADPDSPFAEHISMALPPVSEIGPDRSPRGLRAAAKLGLPQLRRSWYVMFFQLPGLPERLVHRIIPKLWRDWTPAGIDVTDGIAAALDALPTIAHRRAAVSYYRSAARLWAKPLPEYAATHPYRYAAPRAPMLIVHGIEDGAMGVGYTDALADRLPPGSRVEVIDGAGHFVQLDQPRAVCDVILGYLQDRSAANEAS